MLVGVYSVLYGENHRNTCIQFGAPRTNTVMSVLKKSPTGHPDVPGPPLVPKIILTLVECVSVYATYQNISAGVYNPELLKTFQMLVCVAIAVPSAIGFLHRSSKANTDICRIARGCPWLRHTKFSQVNLFREQPIQ